MLQQLESDPPEEQRPDLQPHGRAPPREHRHGARRRHESALNANNIAQASLQAWLAAEGITADITEDVTQLSGSSNYAAIIFLSNSRDALWKHGTAVSPTAAVNTTTSAYLDAAKVNLRNYMRGGGGFVASTTPSAPNTTGRTTKACSATRILQPRRGAERTDHIVGTADSSTPASRRFRLP